MHQFAINLRDYRIVLCTRETLSNVDYHLITEKVAHAISDGEITAEEVVMKIKGKLLTSQEDWDKMLERKKTQNMRHSDIVREETETLSTILTEDETNDAFDLDAKPTEAKVEAKVEDVEKTDETEEKPRRGRPPKAEVAE